MRRIIDRCWKASAPANFDFTARSRFADLRLFTNSENAKRSPMPLRNWLYIYDEYASWFSVLAILLRARLQSDAERNPKNAAAVNSFSGISDEPNSSWPGFFGFRGTNCVRTLRYTTMSLFDYVMMDYMPEKEPSDGEKRVALQALEDHIEHGRKILAQLALYAALNWREAHMAPYAAQLSDPPVD